MKKIIILLLIGFSFLTATSQTVQKRLGLYSNGMSGKIYNDTIYSLSRVAGKYFNAFGDFVSLSDTVHTYFSATSPIFINSSGVISSQAASGAQAGYLTAADWTTFNSKQAAISVTSPITLTGASVGMVNQGTTTTVLHGNAAGNPSFGAIVNGDITNGTIDLTTKVTGALPIANGGTNNGSLSVTNGSLLYTDGTKVVSLGVGTASQHLVGGTIPAWRDTAVAGGAGAYTASSGVVLFYPNFKLQDSGSGARTTFIYSPGKFGAIRSGTVSGTQWDIGNIGLYSAAFGNSNLASGSYSFSAGSGNTASANYSTAIGENNVANTADAVAMGSTNTASNGASIAMGFQNTASGSNAVALGRLNTASGAQSFATGFGANSSGANAITVGFGTLGKSYSGFTAGAYNDATAAASTTAFDSSNRVLQIGGGTTTLYESNIITSLFNGRTGFRVVIPTATVDIAGGTQAAAPFRIRYVAPIATSSIAVVSNTVTITFAAQPTVPFVVGSLVEVVGVTPTVYNGVYIVTAATTATVAYKHATASGAQTIAGTVGIGRQPLTQLDGNIGRDSTNFTLTTGTGSNLQTNKIIKGVVGNATLASGTVTVNSTYIRADSKVFVSVDTPSGTPGFLSAPVGSFVSGASFVINSSSGSENSTVYWEIINP